MLYVEDLRIEEEVLPLFNFTYNAAAEAAVLRLLQELPPTVELVLEKQAVLCGFLSNWPILEAYSYSKVHFQEVRTFLADVSSSRTILEINPVKAAIKLLCSEEARYQSRGRYMQVVQFLRRLQQLYLHPLDLQAFPSSFRPKLLTLVHFLERFSLEDSALAIQQDVFSVTRMTRLARQLQAITVEDLAAFWDAFYIFEAYWSVAKGIRKHDLIFPVFHEKGLHLQDFYHPLLKQPITNTLALDPTKNVIVLTGPNMSGKSTMLKAVGICVYLAHTGLGVPATRCELPFFQSILIAINLRDSLRDGYSHFMAEIQNLKAVLHAAHGAGNTFAVFDELFRGTNVEDALEISSATVRGLTGFSGSLFLISTHLLALESHLLHHPSISTYCIECMLCDGLPVFSYRLQLGWSRLRIGKLLFDKEGLDTLLRLK